MAQLAPSTMEYGQLLALVREFSRDYLEGDFKTPDEVTEKIHEVITSFNELAGQPLLDFEEFQLGEPADSEKMNRMWRALQNDVNILQDQFNILRASAVFLHNFIATEVKLAQNQNAQASNKLKTLQLYSNVHDGNIIQFGDFFSNLDFVDLSLISADEKASLLSPGVISIGRENESVNLSSAMTIRVLNTSNGFAGNNQEIADPSLAISNPADGSKIYVFKAEVDGTHSDLDNIRDEQPNTWFEYEYNQVAQNDRLIAKNYNFAYRKEEYSNTSDDTQSNQGLVDWATGPVNGILKLDLEFDLRNISTINTISYIPFGLDNNRNYPVQVRLVQTSDNGTDWTPISPQNVWITTDANLQSARAADNVVVGTALWTFDERPVRYVRMSIEQPEGVTSNVGHLYYTTSKTVKSTVTQISDPEAPGGVRNETVQTVVGGDRAEGPIPPLSDPTKYYGKNGSISNGLVQNTEYFNGKRWVIGIRDISIQESKYKNSSIIISKSFKINGIVDRVSLEADVVIPPAFGTDDIWVRFYVSPNDGLNWYPISRIQDDFLGIPEIIAFNDPLPADFREVGVQYITTNTTIDSLRVKIELTRPDDLVSSSPILKSYKLKVRKR